MRAIISTSAATLITLAAIFAIIGISNPAIAGSCLFGCSI